MTTRLEPETCPNCGKDTIRRTRAESTQLSPASPLFEHRFTFRCSSCSQEWTLTGVAGEMP